MAAALYTETPVAYDLAQYLLASQKVTTGLTATASGTQTTALALTAAANSVDTVATAADSVKLPLAVAGLSVFVVNTAANSMQVFGSGTDTINAVATATGVAQAGGKSALYVCTASAPAGKWFRLLSA